MAVTEYLSTRDVARALGVSDELLNRQIRHGRIPRPPVLGGARLWSREAIEGVRAVLAAQGRALRSEPPSPHASEPAR